MLSKFTLIPSITIAQLTENTDIRYIKINNYDIIEDKFENKFQIEIDGDNILSFKKKTCGNPAYMMDTLINALDIRFQKEGFDIQETLINYRIQLDGDQAIIPIRESYEYNPSTCCRVD